MILAAKRVRLASVSLPIDSIDISDDGATGWLSSKKKVPNQINEVLGGSSPEGVSFTVINGPDEKTCLALTSPSAVEAIQAIQYTFESRSPSK